MKKQDIELIDSYFEHKRWVKQKQKAMLREFQRERHSLKEKSVAMIEAQVEEQRAKLQKEMEAAKVGQKKGDLHEKLGEQKVEYQRKMKILDEIKRDKARHER